MPGDFPHVRAAAILVIACLPLRAGDLYQTDFENFVAGPNQLVGTDGWLGNSTATGSHGISVGVVPGLGKIAYLGLNQPDTNFVSVFRSVDHDPVAEGTAELEFETLMGIEDSTNGRFDDFYFSFYNTTGDFLGAILFSNDPLTFGIWRLDGMNVVDTTIDFTHGDLHLLCAHIDPLANTWSAEFDGLPLFTDAPFNASGKAITFGPVAAEWQLGSVLPANYGNNWLLVADWRVTAVPPGEEPFVADNLTIGKSGQASLGWTGEPGWNYQVLYSVDLKTWHSDLPNSFFTGLETPTQLKFVDPEPRAEGGKFYSIERLVTP